MTAVLAKILGIIYIPVYNGFCHLYPKFVLNYEKRLNARFVNMFK